MLRDLDIWDWSMLAVLLAVNLVVGLNKFGSFWSYQAVVFALVLIDPLLVNLVFKRASARR